MSPCPQDFDPSGCLMPESCYELDPEAECPQPTHDSMGCPLRDNVNTIVVFGLEYILKLVYVL